MAQNRQTTSIPNIIILVALGAAVAVAVMWATGLFHNSSGPNMRTVWRADVNDKSGGNLIVRDANKQAIPVDLPKTRMTNVPETTEKPTAKPSPAVR